MNRAGEMAQNFPEGKSLGHRTSHVSCDLSISVPFRDVLRVRSR